MPSRKDLVVWMHISCQPDANSDPPHAGSKGHIHGVIDEDALSTQYISIPHLLDDLQPTNVPLLPAQ